MADVEILPGEMRLWSDYGNDRRPAAGGAALVALLDAVPADGAALVVGPHADDLLDRLGAAVVLVRALDDAERIAGRHAGKEVVCGDLVELTGRSFDLVVALDGVERVASNDRPGPAWTEKVALLAGLVAPGGRLLLGVDNDASLLALADARPLAERRDTGDWEPPVSTDLSRPGSAAAAVAALATLGLEATPYAAAWRPSAPTVLVDLGVPADDVRVRAALAAADGLASYPLLLDPVPHAAVALRSGSFAGAASGWVLVAGREAPALTLPAAILAAAGAQPTVLAADDLLDPPGRASVAELAVDCAQREDLPGLRALMGDYLSWVAQEGEARRPDQVVAAEGGFASLPGPVPAGADPLAAAVLLLARRLLAPDIRRVWPHWLHEAEVARTLAAMAELSVTDADVAAAASMLPVAAEPVEDVRTLRALTAQLREELVAERGLVVAQDERMALLERLAERRVAASRQAESAALAAEERARRAEAELARINGSAPRRAARALKDPRLVARKVRNRLRRD